MKEKFLKLFMTMLFALVLTTVEAETVSVSLSREGTLAEKVLEQATSLSTVTALTVSGPINESDWNCITLQMSSLSTLNMKDAVTSFTTMSKLNQTITSFVVPSGIKKLSCRMTQLSFIELSNSVESIGGGETSYNFQNLQTIKFGSGLKSIESCPFNDCYNISEVYIKDLEAWCKVKFENDDCSPFASRGWDSSLTYAKLYVNNELVSDLIVPEVEKINDYAFYGCSSIQNIKISEGCHTIGRYAFSGCANLKKIDFPTSLVEIENCAFHGCSSLTEVSLPMNLKKLSYASFQDCVSLKHITFPHALISIEHSTFSNCKSLEEITFPEALQAIGNSAFSGCSGLTKVTSLIPFPIAATNGIFSGIDIEKCTLVVPEWSAMLYKMAMGWSEFANIETVKTGDLASMTVTDSRYLPASVRPNGTPNVSILSSGSLTVRGETPFSMNEVTLGTSIGEGKWNYGYDDNGNYYEYYSPSLAGAVLINDESNLSAQSARIKLESIGGTWGFISLPFDVKFYDITNDPEKEPSNFVFKYYDGERRGLVGTGGNWQEASNILKAGVGYIYQSQDSASIYLKATPETVGNICNKSNVKTILQDYASEDAEDAGWNFIGNPYPAYFDTHYIDFTAPITVWNGQGYDAISLTDDDFVLSPYQAFFVQKQSDGNAITFFAEGRLAEPRQTNSNSRVASRVAKKDDVREIYNIYLSNGKYTDKCRIVINEQSKIGYDASNDAVKFFSDNHSLPQIYTIGEKDVEYSINERPIATGEIELGVRSTDGLYAISSDSEQQIYLIDRVTNKTIDLSNSDYEFSADESDCNGRFAIRLVNNLSSLNTIDNISDTRIMVDGELLSIQCSEIETINIYSLDGVNVATLNGADSYSIKLSRGIYLVKTHNSVEKIIIR